MLGGRTREIVSVSRGRSAGGSTRTAGPPGVARPGPGGARPRDFAGDDTAAGPSFRVAEPASSEWVPAAPVRADPDGDTDDVPLARPVEVPAEDPAPDTPDAPAEEVDKDREDKGDFAPSGTDPERDAAEPAAPEPEPAEPDADEPGSAEWAFDDPAFDDPVEPVGPPAEDCGGSAAPPAGPRPPSRSSTGRPDRPGRWKNGLPDSGPSPAAGTFTVSLPASSPRPSRSDNERPAASAARPDAGPAPARRPASESRPAESETPAEPAESGPAESGPEELAPLAAPPAPEEPTEAGLTVDRGPAPSPPLGRRDCSVARDPSAPAAEEGPR